jgi:DNA polymerase III subunit gamma/tau
MAENENKPYRVLARKYRPQNFDELVGQDALVRTLTNAITSGRIAHAFMLTGVRGVGKTTTARIIAKALNYTGPDGKAGPTIGSTDDCSLCRAISEDRHPDVMEMDAASRTGVDDIREILDGVRYAPTEARYKVYVIDEVHMLSKNAFNALLKTLEEPPPHVKFIFATTEIRKVPVTVLSRCQRFDLQRVSVDVLSAHYTKICGLENAEIEPEAVTMIARAADGSVRDGLSLLDQAIALSGEKITATLVRDMLGLTDRSLNLDLLEKALMGDIAGALSIMGTAHKNGGMPSVIIQDLLDLTHLMTKLRAVPDIKGMEQFHTADELSRARDMATKLSMPTLGKTWQLLLKGLAEVNEAPNPQSAAEMVMIRLAYAADLPDPSDLIKRLKDQPSVTGGSGMPQGGGYTPQGGQTAYAQSSARVTGGSGGQPEMARAYAAEPVAAIQEQILPTLTTLEDITSLLDAHMEIMLSSQIYHFAHMVKLEHVNSGDNAHGRLEMRIEPEASPRLSQDLGPVLRRITGQRWVVSLVNAGGAPTLAQQADALRRKELDEVSQTPLVENILRIFPEGRLVKIIKTEENKNQNKEEE